MTARRLFAAIALALAVSTPLAQTAPGVNEFGVGSLQQIIDNHRGRPFVLVVWSLECTFCDASMRNLSATMRTRRDLDVVTLATVSLDDDDTRARIAAHLSAFGMTGEAWAFGAAPAPQLRHAIDPAWHGETPRSYWYDASGARVAYSGTITDEVIAKLRPPADQ
jgi:hypothetical protein